MESFQAAPTVDPTGFVPLGCFNDVINDRALTLAAIKGEPDMTTEVSAASHFPRALIFGNMR